MMLLLNEYNLNLLAYNLLLLIYKYIFPLLSRIHMAFFFKR